ncbi:MAG: hypothetical protein H0V40_06130 [Actinobacteria bacterium]|nr:hypothetical protein [Actinomycetota bacterium]
MSTRSVQTAAIEQVETFSGVQNASWHRIRAHFGIEAFGINAWTATEAGQQLIGEHDEVGSGAARHEELYLVVRGHARFTVDGAEIDAPAGTLVFVADPESKRGAVAVEAGTTALVVGGKPGEAFSVSPWERHSEFLRFFETGEYERAIELLRERHAEEPESAGVLYNLACAESLAGRADDALEHLRRSVELDASFAEFAATDSDLDAVRKRPEFASALAGESA